MRAKDPDATMIVRRVGPDVGKVQVKGDKNSSFRSACIEDFGINRAAELFSEHSLYVVASPSQKEFGGARQVLVSLKRGAT